MRVRASWKAMALILALLAVMIPGTRTSAADLLVTNYSFENDLNGWTQVYGTTGITASTDHSYTGTKSAKLTDASSTQQVGIQSGYLAATAGQNYAAMARVYVKSGSANLYIRFHNSSKAVLSSAFVGKSSPQNDWTTIKVKATAPANTAYVSALLYSNEGNTGTVYWDDVFVSPEFSDLGEQVTNSVAHAATFGIGADAHHLYAVMDGANGVMDAKLAKIDMNAETVIASYALQGASGGWAAATATDGKIYAGTFYGGKLYSYSPGASAAVEIGPPFAGASHIRSLTAGIGGRVYGGTFPDAGFFRYYPGTTGGGFMQLGSKPIWGNEEYLQGLDYDEVDDVTYLGIGSHAHLVKFDNATGTKTDILPAAYANEEFVNNVNVEGGKIFARLTPSNQMLVLDKATLAVDAVVPNVGTLGISPELNGKIYYTSAGVIHVYDLAAKTYASLNKSTNLTPVRLGFAVLSDQTNWPGSTLIGIGTVSGQTQMFKYNIHNGNLKKISLNTPETPVTLEEIGTGPDSKIYSSGYLTGGTGVYSPLRDDLDVQYDGVMQTENMLSLNGKMYFAVYPDARLYEYDPLVPWNTSLGNPVKLLDSKDDQQSRPVALTAGGNKIFVGSVANYGQLQGALIVYDLTTGAKTVKKNIINNQSVTALSYLNGKVYGGTSIWGGLGSTPTEIAAKFFVYDVASETTVSYNLPVSGLDAISSLIVGPDNKLWGMAEGYLFVFNPATNTFEYFQQKFSDVNYGSGHVWRDAKLLLTKSGIVFGTIKNKYLFRIDSSKNVVTILSTGAARLTEDDFGNLYYITGTNLKRYVN
ncbi:carbohydrate binding domain-containing protein [Paenibacillus sp. GCM10012303]|uniref:carbohydrate binding domain-containing protein n=1 Tax=Paenibacillus sp. GCM10012303 TaxID=3317340 RepID=UPI00360C36D8